MNFKTILGNVVGNSYFFHQVVDSVFPNQKKMYYPKNDTLVVYSEKGPVSPYTKEVYIIETCEFDIADILKNRSKMFTLEVNMIKRVNGVKYGVASDEVVGRLEGKLKEIGCELKHCNHTNAYTDKTTQKSTGRGITMHCHTVMGLLDIVDIDLFKKNYFNGIGQGKCFGYGLIHFLN